jgi:hypothetical protein
MAAKPSSNPSPGASAVARGSFRTSSTISAPLRQPESWATLNASNRMSRARRGFAAPVSLAASTSIWAASAIRPSACRHRPCTRRARASATGSVRCEQACTASAAALAKSPATTPASAATSRRSAARSGSAVSSAAHRRNDCSLSHPPRWRARSADASSSAATASSGPSAASARCHARRSGSVSGSVTFAKAAWARRRSPGEGPQYAAVRISGWQNATRGDNDSMRVTSGSAAAAGSSPSDAAARRTVSGSPRCSAAATRSSVLAAGGRLLTRSRYNRSPARIGRPGTASGIPRPSPSSLPSSIRLRG